MQQAPKVLPLAPNSQPLVEWVDVSPTGADITLPLKSLTSLIQDPHGAETNARKPHDHLNGQEPLYPLPSTSP
jgi:hypothetical protein